MVSKKIILTDNGQTNYSIFIERSAGECIKFASQELIDYVKKVSGVNLQLKNKVSNKTIILKKSNLNENKRDSFKIFLENSDIVITSSSERGVLYGVYYFIEKFLDVKFLAIDCDFVPKKNKIVIKKLPIYEVPDFEIRSYYANQSIASPVFASRKRILSHFNELEKCGYGFSNEIFGDVHTFQEILPLKEYYQEHNDWYANNEPRAWICLTNGLDSVGNIDFSIKESAVKQVIENLKKVILNNPSIKYFMLGQEDSPHICNCKNCKTALEKYGTLSGLLIVWINAIAREIDKWTKENFENREVYLVTFAYQKTLNPPKNIKAEKNVCLLFAESSSCFFHKLTNKDCPRNHVTKMQIETWRKAVSKIMFWEYGCNYIDYLWYYSNLKSIKANFKFYLKMNGIMILHQSAPSERNFYELFMKSYVVSSLMWNTKINVKKKVKEFNKYYYGKYKNYANNFIKTMEKSYKNVKAFHTDLYDNDKEYFSIDSYKIKKIEKIIDNLKNGIKKAQYNNDEVYEKRLMQILIQPINMMMRFYPKNSNYQREFFQIAEKISLTRYGEWPNHTIEKLREKFKNEI